VELSASVVHYSVALSAARETLRRTIQDRFRGGSEMLRDVLRAGGRQTRFFSHCAFFAVAISCGNDGSVASITDDVRVIITPAMAEIPAGGTVTLTAQAVDAEGHPISNGQVTWTSGAPSIASVNNSGTVTGLTVGTAMITATIVEVAAHADVSVIPPAPQGQVVEVYPELKYQEMTGWEGVAQMGEVECNRQAFKNYRVPLTDRIVNELGINRVRLPIQSGAENPTDWYAQYIAGNLQAWRSNRYQIVNDNGDPRSANPQGFHFTGLDYLVDSVVNPMRARLAARGERLYVNLDYTDFGASTFEHSTDAEEYAELMLEAFRHLQSRNGWVPDAIEIILEPDNTQNWTGSRIGAVIKATGDRLKAAGFSPDFIAPSTSSMSSAVTYFDQLINVPGVRSYLTDLSYHRYGGVSAAALAEIRARAAQYGIRTAMLEHIGSGVEDLHEDLTKGGVSAWEQFTLAYCASDDGSAYYLVNQSNPAAPVVNMGNLTRYLRQYFSFVRLGAIRIGAASGDSRFLPVAFQNPNGKLVVVIQTTGAASFTVRRLPAGAWGATWTTASQTFTSGPDIQMLPAGTTVNIPAAGVITLVQR
jgi:hypothetical protein